MKQSFEISLGRYFFTSFVIVFLFSCNDPVGDDSNDNNCDFSKCSTWQVYDLQNETCETRHGMCGTQMDCPKGYTCGDAHICLPALGCFTNQDCLDAQATVCKDGRCTNDDCSKMVTPAGVRDLDMGTVMEQDTVSMDISNGIVVLLPFTVSVGTPILSGASVSVDGSTITYHAPPAGTVPSDGTMDSFSFSVTDSSQSPDNMATATMTVSVYKTQTPDECIPSPTIECKTPDLDISTTGEIRYISRRGGVTQVWTIPPGYRQKVQAHVIISYLTGLPLTFSMSDSYAVDSPYEACTLNVDNSEGKAIWYVENGQTFWCNLDPEKTYFLRISGENDGEYWLQY